MYATVLGIEIGAEAAAPVKGSPVSAVEQPVAAILAPISTEIDLDDPNLVDYVKNYDEIVLGEKPINWGNAILLGLIGLVTVGGGGFVVIREKLVKVSFGDTRKAEGEYPADVVEMLPAIVSLKSTSRKSLRNVLNNPKKAETILDLIEAVVSGEKTEE